MESITPDTLEFVSLVSFKSDATQVVEHFSASRNSAVVKFALQGSPQTQKRRKLLGEFKFCVSHHLC